jgi:hypothetical protein
MTSQSRLQTANKRQRQNEGFKKECKARSQVQITTSTERGRKETKSHNHESSKRES